MVAHNRLYRVVAFVEMPGKQKDKRVPTFVLRHMTLEQCRVVVRKTFRGKNVYGTIMELPSRKVHIL